MHKYQVVVWWSQSDNAFLAMAPELAGCIADGETRDAALAMLDEVIDLWLETARDEGWQAPAPKGKLLAVQNEFDWQPVSQTAPSAKSLPSRTTFRVPHSKSAESPRAKTRKSHVETKNAV